MKNLKRITRYFFVSAASLAFVFFAQGVTAQTRLENPLDSSFSDIPSFIAGALKVLVMVALPLIALFIVVAGFMFIKARGNPSDLTKAKDNFLYVIIGALLILGAWVIATLISGTVSQLLGR